MGRNVVDGRWDFKVGEEYDYGDYGSIRDHERRAREQLVGGQRHESEMNSAHDGWTVLGIEAHAVSRAVLPVGVRGCLDDTGEGRSRCRFEVLT